LSLDKIAAHIDTVIKGLDMKWYFKPALYTGVGFAKGNVWSRAARRKKMMMKKDSANEDMDVDVDVDEDENLEDEIETAELGVKILVNAKDGGGGGVTVDVRWLVGRDNVLFESFCGMLKREVEKLSIGVD
jgi:23S rRNA (adenine1618-N6)-methyltransferase